MTGRNRLIAKVALSLALLIVGYCSVSRSLAMVWSNVNPTTALTIWNGDARIAAMAAQGIIEKAQTDADRQAAVRLARRALLRDGTVIPAADTLAFAAGYANDEASAVTWFRYVERLSRRDLRAQLYFIEESVAEGDVKQALHHYDIALRTSEVGAPTTLFPVLRGAVGDANIRKELIRTLAGRPSWANNFLSDLSSNGPDFVAAGELVVGMRRAGLAIPDGVERALLNNLVAQKDVAAAWRIYAMLHPKALGSMIRNSSFETTNTENSPFDWQLSSDNGVSVDVGTSAGKGVLDYRLSPTTGATVARQILFLTNGKYRLASVLLDASQKRGEGPYWQLSCVDGPTIGTLEMGAPLNGAQSFSTDVVVPAGCATQTLLLTVRATDDINGATGQLGSVSIAKVEQ